MSLLSWSRSPTSAEAQPPARASSPTSREEEAPGGAVKRNIGDTSILDNFSSDNKRGNFNDSNASQEHSLSVLTSMKALLESMDSKLDTVVGRINILEERVSSMDIVIDNLQDRVRELESANVALLERIAALETRPGGDVDMASAGSGVTWVPTGSPETSILLLGDSNSAGKIKFGAGKGKLGAALPGTSKFCAKFDNLPAPDSAELTNISDLVLAVGTNNLRQEDSDPAELA